MPIVPRLPRELSTVAKLERTWRSSSSNSQRQGVGGSMHQQGRDHQRGTGQHRIAWICAAGNPKGVCVAARTGLQPI